MTNAERPCVRCRVLYIPTEDRGGWFLSILAVGIIFFWILAYLLVLALLAVILQPTGDPPGWMYMSSVLGGALGPVSWVLYYEPRQRRLARRKQQQRDARLAQILGRTASFRHAPHRHVESILRQERVTTKAIFREISLFNSPELIVVQNAVLKERIVPILCDRLFEPIEIGNDNDNPVFEELSLSATRSQGVRGGTQRPTKTVLSGLVGRTVSLVVALVLLLIVGRTVMKAMAGSADSLLIVLGVGSFLAASWFLTLLYERRWWLVPGALVYREVTAWRKEMRVGLFSAQDSTLVLDLRTGDGYLSDGRHNFQFSFGDSEGLGIASAWMNATRSPTLKKMRSFFGADQN